MFELVINFLWKCVNPRCTSLHFLCCESRAFQEGQTFQGRRALPASFEWPGGVDLFDGDMKYQSHMSSPLKITFLAVQIATLALMNFSATRCTVELPRNNLPISSSEDQLGHVHPETLATASHLARVLQDQSRTRLEDLYSEVWLVNTEDVRMWVSSNFGPLDHFHLNLVLVSWRSVFSLPEKDRKLCQKRPLQTNRALKKERPNTHVVHSSHPTSFTVRRTKVASPRPKTSFEGLCRPSARIPTIPFDFAYLSFLCRFSFGFLELFEESEQWEFDSYSFEITETVSFWSKSLAKKSPERTTVSFLRAERSWAWWEPWMQPTTWRSSSEASGNCKKPSAPQRSSLFVWFLLG